MTGLDDDCCAGHCGCCDGFRFRLRLLSRLFGSAAIIAVAVAISASVSTTTAGLISEKLLRLSVIDTTDPDDVCKRPRDGLACLTGDTLLTDLECAIGHTAIGITLDASWLARLGTRCTWDQTLECFILLLCEVSVCLHY